MNDDDLIWDMYFAGICAMQFHPKNHENYINNEQTLVDYCSEVADTMLAKRKERWPTWALSSVQ